MSVTFNIESLPTGTFTIGCYDEELGRDVEVARADSHEAILVERGLHLLVCEECRHYGCFATPVFDVDDEGVNLANTNAAMILSTLGYDTSELVGSADASDFLARVILAMAEDRDDSGVAAVDIHAGVGGGARMVDCGLRPGYFADTFAALHTVALEADRLGRTVVWA